MKTQRLDENRNYFSTMTRLLEIRLHKDTIAGRSQNHRIRQTSVGSTNPQALQTNILTAEATIIGQTTAHYEQRKLAQKDPGETVGWRENNRWDIFRMGFKLIFYTFW